MSKILIIRPLRQRNLQIDLVFVMIGLKTSHSGALGHIGAQKPFDPSATADAVLRSSDSVDFFIIKLLLCLVSPVFSDMLSSNHTCASEDETRNGLPVIPVTESSETLHCLLLLIYPPYVSASEPVLLIGDLCRVAEAAQKYCMDCIEDKIRKTVITSGLLEEHAFRVYVSALHVGWTDIAATAALNSLKTPLSDLPSVEELRIISGADFYYYLTYRFKHEKHARGEGEEPKLTFASEESPMAANEQPSTLIPTDVPSPFGQTAKTNAILRSSDDVDFYVNKSFLSYLSPVFEELFANGDGVLSETDERGNNSSVFIVEEDSDSLYGLLCFLHPYADEPSIKDLKLYPKIWTAAQHYEVIFITQRLEQSFLSHPFIQKEPLRAFAISINLNWAKASKASAMETLTGPLSDMKYADELRLITGADLYRLIEYRFECANVVRLLLDQLDERARKGSSFVRYTAAVKPKLLECPRGIGMMKADDDLVKTAGVGSDIKSVLCYLLEYRRVMAPVIDEIVSKVRHFSLSPY